MEKNHIGFPSTKPDTRPFTHGWFLQTHINVFSQLITPDTKVIVEIGSWYGSSAKWLAEHSPDDCKLYAIDLWDDDFIRKDDHYQSQKFKLLREHPLYETFLVNLWSNRDRVVPLRMDSVTGLEYLKSKNVVPDIIYIDADHHYEAVMRDIGACLRLFPSAILVGDDYGNYDDVRKAVQECALAAFKTVHVDTNHCWTYQPLISSTGRNIVPKPSGKLTGRSFADSLRLYKSTRLVSSRDVATSSGSSGITPVDLKSGTSGAPEVGTSSEACNSLDEDIDDVSGKKRKLL